MLNESRLDRFKSFIRFILCRHKNTEIRTVRTGPDMDNLKIICKFKYCLDCNNAMYDKEVEDFNEKLRIENERNKI